ncbi:MAG: hypothetical protein HYV40_00595, partial [Candidatus Levybacteria bacterium]|nr:hypothetical protein [Candidatus Levybacteria bacterium]
MSGSLTMVGANSIQTTSNTTLTLGGSTTGNIVLSPLNSIAGGKVLPGADNLVSLGSSPSGRFKDLFLGPSSLHVICTTGDGCGAGGLDYALGVNTSTGTFSIGVNGATSVGNPLLNVTQGGNVGIGTTAPASLNGRAPVLEIASGSTDLPGLVLRSGHPTYPDDWEILLNAPTGGESGFNVSVGTTNVLHIRKSGSVGINSTSPLATLDVRGNSGTLPIASFSGTTSFAGLIVDNTGLGDIFTASSSGLNRFVVKQSGNVGIGTTNPQSRLTLKASGYRG